jgi:hypothetical protein
MENLNIQSIFFNKRIFTLNNSTEWLINNKLGDFKRVNEDRYYYRYTFQSRIKLQQQNYIKQTKYIENDNIKIEHYTKPDFKVDFLVEFN